MPEETLTTLNVLEALHSTPARRYLSTKEIPDRIIWDLLDAAIRAPSGGNSQEWNWIVLKDQEKKDQISEWYREGWQLAYGIRRQAIMDQSDSSDTLGPRNYLSAEYLANHIHEAPIWIIGTLRNTSNSGNPRAGSSIYGAIQNLMLAARAYGIGSTLTTLYAGHEEDVKHLLGIPDDAMTMALIPLGYPKKGKWSQPKRQAVEEVTHWDFWGNAKKR
jgi:nitroreductase